jgi:putative DNA primase/helicase
MDDERRERGEAILDKEAQRLRAKLRLISGTSSDSDDTVTPEACGIDPDQDWKAQLITKTAQGKTSYPCRAHNLMVILENDQAWKGLIQLDEFRQWISYRGSEFMEHQAIELKAWLEKNWISSEVKTAVVHEAIETVAARHSHHPVRDWLERLSWDGIERIPTFFKDYCGTPFSPYSEAVARSFFVSAACRILCPGRKVDTMVVLEGEQGLGKSKLIQALFGADWHCEITEAPGSLDFYQNLRGKWVGEFSELSAMGKADQNRVKQALTSTHDTYRASYGRKSRSYPRQFIFIGNTNKTEYLSDETGARRYLPIVCTDINDEAAAGMRDALWAEAVHRYRAGEIWWEIPDAKAEQAARYQMDVWEDYVGPWLQGKSRVTISEILNDVLFIKTERQGRNEQTRVGAILRRLNWVRKQEPTGARIRYYVPPSGENR